MDQLTEFVSNNFVLFIALAVIIILLLRAEIKRATRGFREISPTEAVQQMNHENALLLDVREDSEMVSGSIAGSRHIAMSVLKQRINELSEFSERPVIAYCKTGLRSTQACELLRKANFNHVSSLKGGLEAWRNANLPLKKK